MRARFATMLASPLLASVLLASTFAGCAASEVYRDHAFVPLARHYRVRYVRGEEPSRRVLPPGWRVLDYRVDGRGRPTTAFDRRSDRVLVAIDSDGDERPDLRGETARFDLHYEHEEDGSELAISTVPVGPRLARRSLEVLAHELVEGSLGAGFVEWRRDRAHVFATRVADERAARVGGAPAYLMTLEVAEVIPGRGPAFGNGRMVTMVLVRPGELGWRPGSIARPHEGAGMLVLVTYSARSDRFELHRRDVDALLDRLDVRPDAFAPRD